MLIYNNSKYLTIEELSDYLPEKPSKKTIYNWTHRGRIPFHKWGKQVYFETDAIDNWNKSGRPAND